VAKKKAAKKTGALTVDTYAQLKAIASPLRQQLLQEFAKEPATTKQVALALGLKPTRLYHHVAKLESSGLIKLVETKPVRGATEKYYQAVAGCVKIDRAALPEGAAQRIGDAMSLNVIDGLWTNIRNDVADVLEEANAGDVNAGDVEEEIMFVQAELEVDKETAGELKAKILQALEDVDSEARKKPGTGKVRRKYRVTLGWQPLAAKKGELSG